MQLDCPCFILFERVSQQEVASVGFGPGDPVKYIFPSFSRLFSATHSSTLP